MEDTEGAGWGDVEYWSLTTRDRGGGMAGSLQGGGCHMVWRAVISSETSRGFLLTSTQCLSWKTLNLQLLPSPPLRTSGSSSELQERIWECSSSLWALFSGDASDLPPLPPPPSLPPPPPPLPPPPTLLQLLLQPHHKIFIHGKSLFDSSAVPLAAGSQVARPEHVTRTRSVGVKAPGPAIRHLPSTFTPERERERAHCSAGAIASSTGGNREDVRSYRWATCF